MSNICQLLQSNNSLTISREVTRIKENNYGIKSMLAASNGACWLTTSATTITSVRKKWICQLNKRKHVNSIKGSRSIAFIKILRCKYK